MCKIDLIIGFLLGLIFAVGIMAAVYNCNTSSPQNMINACQKQHNVYRCEIVAVPVKESK